METRLAFPFTATHDGSDDDVAAVLGGKGAALAAMTAAGLPVPPGFTIATTACRTFLDRGWTPELEAAIEEGVAELEGRSGKSLGSPDAPLLVSVRSGAPTSMPGMMDTVLNLGITGQVEATLGRLTGNPEFAADTHRRGLIGFAEIVLGADRAVLDRCAAAASPAGVIEVLASAGLEMPTDPMTQIKLAVRAVFESWHAPRAISYREVEGIDGALATAANVQAMVFGNMGKTSGTGVAFTRNPTTGADGLMGDFLPNAQGEDVVAGGQLTRHLDEMRQRWPEIYAELDRIGHVLESRYRDMVDIEFTVEEGRLWMLQSRRGKRSPIAAFRMAIDMANDPDFPVDQLEAVARCRRYLDDPPTVTDAGADADLSVVANGLGASPGRASGVLCLDPDRAVELADQGFEVILARRETSPADVHGMAVAKGLFTTLGGQVSHAALVAREWGLPAVVGASEAEVTAEGVVGPAGLVAIGSVVTVDGDGGRLLLGQSSAEGTVAPEVMTIRSWEAAATAESTPGAQATGGEQQATGGEQQPERASRADDGALAFGVHHALRIKGMVTADAIAAICDASEDAVRPFLDDLVAGGNATFMEPRQMWVITPDGRASHQPLLADAVSSLDLDGLPYRDFLALNDDFKQLCTDWQVKDGQPNDHSDEAYDRSIFDRLAELHERSLPIVSTLAAAIPWLAPYGSRLTGAKERLANGDPKALTGVMCDSYHDIWMELHEDLILTQGIDRAAEGST